MSRYLFRGGSGTNLILDLERKVEKPGKRRLRRL